MTVRKFLFFVGFATGISWLAVGLIVWRVDPYSTGMFGHLLFYSSLFFALFGTSAFVGFFTRMLLFKKAVPFAHIGVSIRQGVLLSLLVTNTLLLVGNNLLQWWNGLLLFTGLVMFEGFFQLAKPRRSRRHL